MQFYEYETPMGRGWVEAEGDRVTGVLLPGSPRPASVNPAPAAGEAREIIAYLEAFFRGEGAGGGPRLDSLLDTAGMEGFTRRVMEEVAGIPYGETLSYGEVAAAAGSPRAARAVGNVMAANPFPILVPCHRVVRVTGEPGGFAGSPGLKEWLLELESGMLS